MVKLEGKAMIRKSKGTYQGLSGWQASSKVIALSERSFLDSGSLGVELSAV